jgi:hypothetical protein
MNWTLIKAFIEISQFLIINGMFWYSAITKDVPSLIFWGVWMLIAEIRCLKESKL